MATATDEQADLARQLQADVAAVNTQADTVAAAAAAIADLTTRQLTAADELTGVVDDVDAALGDGTDGGGDP